MIQGALRELHKAVTTLDSPESLKILNINEDTLDSPETTLAYIERCKAWSRLRNIVRSIPDLLSQSESVALVGFLGHFSSGKSSLINAILGASSAVDGPGYKRDVGVHPTDTRITLIAHPSHARSAKTSPYSAIGDVDVVHGPDLDFLKNATLVDTPGLGNEAAEHDAVTRFLHLCHVLVITIDGRRPFADRDKDFALLDTAFNKLDGVPKILVVTSAEEFLPSRRASFDAWQEDKADAFWAESIRRLNRDSRFEHQLDRLLSAPRFFVDSKEGFRVDEVVKELLPIVTDDDQRERIRIAQARYVLETAHEALGVLLRYISVRSSNLSSLRTSAQKRAENTATVVEELLHSLETALGSVKNRLKESRRSIPTDTFVIDSVVTPSAIRKADAEALGALETETRQALEERLSSVRAGIWRTVRRTFRRRTRAWFGRRDVQLGLQARIQVHLDVAQDIPGLAESVESCTQSMVRLASQRSTAAIGSYVEHLRSPVNESWQIGSRTRDVEVALGDFQHKHDDSVRGFYAYVTDPSSVDLLREHGFVEYDGSGQRAAQLESINALSCSGFAEIEQSSERCKDRLRSLSFGEVGELSTTDGQAWVVDGDFLETCREYTRGHIDSVCQRALDDFVSRIGDRVDRAVDASNAAWSVFAEARRQIWRARRTFAIRLACGGVVLAGLWAVVNSFAPGLLAAFDSVRQQVYVGVATTVAVTVLQFLIAGPKNETLRSAMRPSIAERAAFWRTWQGLERGLEEHFGEAYGDLLSQVDEESLEVDKAIAVCVVKGLKERSMAYRGAVQSLSDLRRAIDEKCEVLDEYSAVVNQRLGEIPGELKGRASSVKNDAVQGHLSRIQEAADSVYEMESDIRRIAAIAEPHLRSS